MKSNLQEISLNYRLALNIYNAAVHHRKNCSGPYCNVSLLQLKMAADKLMHSAPIIEQREYQDMDWSF